MRFRNRVAENCHAEVASEDAVKEDKPSNGLVEKADDIVARCHQNHQVPCGEPHTRRTPEKTPRFCRGWWNMRGAFRPGARRVEMIEPFERLHGKKPTQEFVRE